MIQNNTTTDGTERMQCVECGSELTDPKNRGDPDVNGDWVCSQSSCRAIHDVEMTCDIVTITNTRD